MEFRKTRMFSIIVSVQFSSVAQSCLILCDPMNCSMPGLPVHHQLPEFTQTHVHRVSDAIQPSHPLSSPSPPAPNPSQHHAIASLSIPALKLVSLASYAIFKIHFNFIITICAQILKVISVFIIYNFNFLSYYTLFLRSNLGRPYP